MTSLFEVAGPEVNGIAPPGSKGKVRFPTRSTECPSDLPMHAVRRSATAIVVHGGEAALLCPIALSATVGPMAVDEFVAIAKKNNERLVKSVDKRADAPEGVIRFCLADYNARLAATTDEHPLNDLTRHLLDTFGDTQASIRARMESKHAGKSNAAALVESSTRNSLMRSAGTNYQGLVSYAIAKYLLDAGSAWYVAHPVPAQFAQLLAIRFGPAVVGDLMEPESKDVPPPPGEEVDDGAGMPGADSGLLEDSLDETLEAAEPGEDASASVDVKPDVDILIRNAAWVASEAENEPILLLSVKTSLADRAGSAARWKTYFDIVTRPCAHAMEEDCVYRHLGMTLANDPKIDLTHGIVTANIYKVNSDAYFAKYGELRTNQVRSNTFMFDLRFATRNTTPDLIAPGWEPLVGLPAWLEEKSLVHGLPG